MNKSGILELLTSGLCTKKVRSQVNVTKTLTLLASKEKRRSDSNLFRNIVLSIKKRISIMVKINRVVAIIGTSRVLKLWVHLIER